MFADHFSAVAAKYAAYRPQLPPAVVDALADRCPSTELAWDAGCGSGQFSVPLARRFARVIATDPAQAQLDAAEPHPRVSYACASAEDGIAERADLVVAAQAAHWFDWPRWLTAIERSSKPGALVALITYGDVDVGELVRAYLADVASYWPPGREHVDNGYRDLSLPWPAVDIPPIDMVVQWTRDELFGYVTTWSSTNRYVKTNGPDRLARLEAELAASWPDGERRDVRWPLTIKAARR
jgi:SAM-dependent methyltransferase